MKYWLLVLLISNVFFSFAQRAIHIFAHDSLAFSYASSQPQTSVMITDVPDSMVRVSILVNNQRIVKRVPFSDDIMSYELRPGNNGTLGIWYRGDAGCGSCPKVVYTPSDTFDATPKITATTSTHTAQQDDSTPLVAETKDTEPPIHRDEWIALSDSVDAEDKERADDVRIASGSPEPIGNEDVWNTLSDAEFEYDRLRILRDYFVKSNCTREDVFKALEELSYDPSRLELCRHLVNVCADDVQTWQSDIAETFFIYPHFRSEFQSLFP